MRVTFATYGLKSGRETLVVDFCTSMLSCLFVTKLALVWITSFTSFQATHKRTREVSVLKVLKDTYGDDMKKEMFLEEIRLLHKVCHPNVLK